MRIGIIGSGGRGRIGRFAHRPAEGVRVVACCNVDENAFAADRALYGPDLVCVRDYRALLDVKLDAVFVTAPDWLHEEHALAALARGLAVYLEKPMAISLAGCDRLLEAAAAGPGRLFVGHNLRCLPLLEKMHALIAEGAIGRVKNIWCRHFVGHGGDFFFKDWHSERRHVNSLLLQKGCHDIDVMHWFAGARAQRVTAMGGLSVYGDVTDRRAGNAPARQAHYENWPPLAQKGLSPTIDIEDNGMVLIQFENGVQGCYLECHYTPDYWRSYTVIGTEGRLENFGFEEIRLWNRRCDYDGAGHQTWKFSYRNDGHGGADERIVGKFLRFVRDGGAAPTSPLDSRYSVAVGCLAAESLRTDGYPRTIPGVSAAVKIFFDRPTSTPPIP